MMADLSGLAIAMNSQGGLSEAKPTAYKDGGLRSR